MVRKTKLPKLEIKAPSSMKKKITGNLVEKSELPKDFTDFNRFNPKNQSMYKNPFKKSKR